jgi:hypothetical protein
VLTLGASPCEEDGLRSALWLQWQEGKFCDVQISAGEQCFDVHRNLLAAASPYFVALLGDRFSEASSSSPISLPGISAAVFSSVLQFIYRRTCSCEEKELQAVLEAACQLQVADLQAAAERAIIQRLTPANCLDAWNVASHLSLATMMNAAKETALSHFEEMAAESSPGGPFDALPAMLLDELLKDDKLRVKDEMIAFKALERWIAAQPSPPAEEAALLSRIRFAHMSKEQRCAVESSSLIERHPMVVLTAYREYMNKERTLRTRLRVGQRLVGQGPIQYDTRRTYLGTWNCGRATVTFDARGVSWLPAETFPTPVTQSYPLVRIPWSAITGGQIDKVNCSLVLWALHELPFQSELFNFYSPMSDRHDPQSSIYIVMEPTQFHDRGGASSITQFLKDKSSLIAFVAPGKLLGRPPLRVRLIPGRV